MPWRVSTKWISISIDPKCNEDVNNFLNDSLRVISDLNDVMQRSNQTLERLTRETQDIDKKLETADIELSDLENSLKSRGCNMTPYLEHKNKLFRRSFFPVYNPRKFRRKPVNELRVNVNNGNSTNINCPKTTTHIPKGGKLCIEVHPVLPNNTKTGNNRDLPTNYDTFFYYVPLVNNINTTSADKNLVSNKMEDVTCKIVCCPKKRDKGKCFEVIPELKRFSGEQTKSSYVILQTATSSIL